MYSENLVTSVTDVRRQAAAIEAELLGLMAQEFRAVGWGEEAGLLDIAGRRLRRRAEGEQP